MKRKINLAKIAEKIFRKFGVETGVMMIATLSVKQLAEIANGIA